VNLRFNKLSMEDMARIVAKILLSEGVEFELNEQTKQALTMLLDYVNGDLRRALNYLEAVITSGRKLTVEVIQTLIPVSMAHEALQLAISGNWEQALKKLEDAYIQNKLEPQLTIEQLYVAIGRLNVPTHVKLKMYDKLAEAERGIKIGCNPLIQLAGFLASVYASTTELPR
jgi:DNA polymerase III delta prime subunit